MNVAPALAAALQPALPPVPALALGQVVTALVLQRLDTSRYLVRMLGEERVVESMSPLRTQELVQARVVALGDRIELERITDPGHAVEQGGSGTPQPTPGSVGDVIAELFNLYRGELAPDDAERLRRAGERSARPERMALAGLVLRKLGLPLDAELLEPLYQTLAGAGGLAPLPADAGAATPPAWWPVGQCVLNAQAGGQVCHRLGALPLQQGAKQINIEAALFEERDGGARRESTVAYRKVVLALETEGLGRLELGASMADERLRVVLAAERRESTNAFLRNGESLASALARGGWQVDEIAYETRPMAAPGGPVQAALEHLIAPGSVDRLL